MSDDFSFACYGTPATLSAPVPAGPVYSSVPVPTVPATSSPPAAQPRMNPVIDRIPSFSDTASPTGLRR